MRLLPEERILAFGLIPILALAVLACSSSGGGQQANLL